MKVYESSGSLEDIVNSGNTGLGQNKIRKNIDLGPRESWGCGENTVGMETLKQRLVCGENIPSRPSIEHLNAKKQPLPKEFGFLCP